MGRKGANEATFARVQRNPQGIAAVLSSAFCEWFLIFLLFIDASFSYLVTKFAHYCELPAPCLFCSRLDHVFGNPKPDFYLSLLCNNHRLEVSSSISCQVHGKLADGYKMCEECLFSVTKKNKPNPEMHRLMEGKLGVEHGGHGFRANTDFIPSCSCCNKPWKSKHSSQRMFLLRTPMARVTKPNIPLPRITHRRLHRRDLKKTRDKYSESVASKSRGKNLLNSLSHVGHSGMKITSDCESEFPFSDGDVGNSIFHDHREIKEGTVIPCASESEIIDMRSSAPRASIGRGLGDKNWHQDCQKVNPSDEIAELVSLQGAASSSSVVDVPPGVSKEKDMVDAFPPPLKHSASAPCDLASLESLLTTSPSAGASPKKSVDATGVANVGHVSITKHEEVKTSVNTTTEEESKADHASTDPEPSQIAHVDANDMHEAVGSSDGREGSASEKPSTKDLDGAKEHSELRSSAQVTDTSSNNTSPQAHQQSDEVAFANASKSRGIQVPQSSHSVERAEESGSECLEGTEGENVADRLKRRVKALYKELEEERNAATSAANEAMAMITRLQEEKAALHMEALQYLRMMEEQAEHDVDALEKANDLLAEREKDIQDLEAELEFYRLNYPDELMDENMTEGKSELKAENVAMKNTSVDHVKNNSISVKVNKGINEPAVELPWFEFKDEKLYISQCLKSMESKLQQFSADGTGRHNEEDVSNNEGTQFNSQIEENDLPPDNQANLPNGRSSNDEASNASVSVDGQSCKENNYLDTNRQKSLMRHREVDMVTLGNEIADLNDRLETLEANQDFLEHTLRSLLNGNEGLLFVQEIARQLLELQKIGIRITSNLVS